MLHTKLQDHQSTGSGVEDFFKDFIIYGCGGHIGHVNIFSFYQPQMALNGIWLQLAQWL